MSYIEGKRAVLEALRAGAPVKEVLVSDALTHDSLLTDICRAAKRACVPLSFVPKAYVNERSATGRHQGVLAQIEAYRYTPFDKLLGICQNYAATHDGRALVLVLDHLTDVGNFGTIIRSAVSVGACGIVIPRTRSVAVEASSYKSSAGALAYMPISQVSNLSSCLKHLQREGFWVCGATEHARKLIWDSNLQGKCVLVLGNEATGISRLVRENCDFLARLPMEGEVASLNVAQAASVCMYEWLRQNRRISAPSA